MDSSIEICNNSDKNKNKKESIILLAHPILLFTIELNSTLNI